MRNSSNYLIPFRVGLPAEVARGSSHQGEQIQALAEDFSQAVLRLPLLAYPTMDAAPSNLPNTIWTSSVSGIQRPLEQATKWLRKHKATA